jgi:hypothetical protein
MCDIIAGASAIPFIKTFVEYVMTLLDLSLLCRGFREIKYNNWTFPESPVSLEISG